GLSEQEARTFALERSLHPHTVPVEADDLYREQALARLAIRGALRRARPAWPKTLPGPRADLLPACDLIIGGGAALGRAPSAGAAALLLLDSLQPTGLTTLTLDQNHLLAALGAAAYANPLAAVQVLESDALLRLGVVVSLLGAARPDEVVCTAKLTTADGQETSVTVKAGTLEVLPLPLGQAGKLTLKPRSGVDLGFGPGRGQTLELDNGGAVGVIIDARGRPIAFPREAARRAELVQQWIWKLSGT
ncbi:MAG: glutamate mutase L, partial [Anaerolineales bacterium]|nr:glutamate mutase L [Anaerolineales bacterium]